MFTIAFDSSSAEKKQRTGVEEYAWQLAEGFRELALLDPKIKLIFYNHETLRWPFGLGWMQLRVTWELLRRPPAVFFVPAQNLPFFISKKIKVATTIHDIGFLRRPDLYSGSEVGRQKSAVRRAVRRADIIFTPSEFTKSELIELCRAKSEKIIVTPLAMDKNFVQLQKEDTQKVLDRYRLGYKNYFLFVSRVDAKKNPTVLFSAFDGLKKQLGFGDPLRLVFAGPPGCRFEAVKKQHEKMSAKDFVSWLGYVPREDLPALMNGALALVAPSWYEGFGLTLLEAAACGTPVVASDIPAHREVMGEAALFVPPDQPEQWASALKKIVADQSLVAGFSAKGLERTKGFSWPLTVKKTWETLWSLVV